MSFYTIAFIVNTLQYHGGIFFGKSLSKPHHLANRISNFMIVTLFGGPKFLCKMFSLQERDWKLIFEQTNLMLNAIKKAGGISVDIICDVSWVSQGFFKMFSTAEPWSATARN